VLSAVRSEDRSTKEHFSLKVAHRLHLPWEVASFWSHQFWFSMAFRVSRATNKHDLYSVAYY